MTDKKKATRKKLYTVEQMERYADMRLQEYINRQ